MLAYVSDRSDRAKRLTAPLMSSRCVVIFQLAAHTNQLTTVLGVARQRRAHPVVINCSWSAGVESGDWPELVVHHISDYFLADRVRDARQLATDWMQQVPLQMTEQYGASLLDAATGRPGALWWQFEIILQEKAFFAVRLIETIDEILRGERPESFVILGDHATQPWQREVIDRVCMARGVLPFVTVPLIAIDAPVEPVRALIEKHLSHGAVDLERGYLGRSRVVKHLSSSGGHVIVTATKKLIGIVLGIPLLLLGVLFSFTLAAALFPIWLLWWAWRRGVVAGYLETLQKLLRLLRRFVYRFAPRLAVVLIVLVMVFLLSSIVWIIEPRLFLLVPLGILFASIYAIVSAPAQLSLVETIGWPLNQFEERVLPLLFSPRRLARTLLRRDPDMTRRARTPREITRTRPRVMLLVEEADFKQRRNLSRGGWSEYNPYFEGIIDAFARADRCDVWIVAKGSATPLVNPIDRFRRWRRRRQLGDWLHINDAITGEMRAAGASAEKQRLNEWRRLVESDAPRRGFHYRSIDLWPIFADDARVGYLSIAETSVEREAFSGVLDAVSPDLVVAYNFEGVFRRWTPEAIVRRIPLLGVQQALGPYGHALNHSATGYSRPLAPRNGAVPTPDVVAVWGERHVRELRDFDYPAANLALTGYARTDTYINEKDTIDRNAVRRALGIGDPSARIIVFTLVWRVLGSGLMLDEHWLQTFRDLIAITESDPSLYLIVKPWGGDDMELIQRATAAYGTPKVIYVDPRAEMHNVELLAVSDILIGTFSSIFAEAVIMDVIPILLDYPETTYYFGADYVAQYAELSWRATSPSEACLKVRDALDATDDARAAFHERALAALPTIFGPVDGRAAERIAEIGLNLAS